MSEWTISVTQLNEYVRKMISGDPMLRSIRVRGELSGVKRHTSGHIYFTLKDEGARIQCVMFRQQALYLSFQPCDGMQVVVTGSASLYTQSGAYQLYADAMRQGEPERGAFVFYDCICNSEHGPVNWGHCGISLGNGGVIHAWDVIRIDNYLDIERMTALSGDNPRYIGWVPIERVLTQKPD